MKNLTTIFSLITCFAISFACSDNETEPLQPKEEEKPIVHNIPIRQPINVDDIEINLTPGKNKFISQNMERKFLLRIPSSYHENKPIPLVIVLQGSAKPGSITFFEKRLKFSSLGEKEGFITIYPISHVSEFGRTQWRPGTLPLVKNSYSDIVFMAELIEILKRELSIDHKRIYMVGHSDGAFFTYNFALHYSDKLAAIGVSAGLLTRQLPIEPITPLPVIHLHGLKDNSVQPIIPSRFSTSFFNAQKSLDFWIDNNQNSSIPEVLRNDDDLFIRKWNTSNNNNADVVYIQAKKAFHVWFEENNIAKIDGTNEIWEFFKTHPKL